MNPTRSSNIDVSEGFMPSIEMRTILLGTETLIHGHVRPSAPRLWLPRHDASFVTEHDDRRSPGS